MTTNCYHCGEQVPQAFDLTVEIEEKAQPMCCYGCHAIAESIVQAGLTDYYKYRTEFSEKGDKSLVPDELQHAELLDDKAFQDEFAIDIENDRETILSIAGINCSACAWLIEKQVLKIAGVKRINVNATTQRATVRWDEKVVKLSAVIQAITHIGYHATPFKAHESADLNLQQRKSFVKRLGVSGILMMQVLMLAFALYFGAFSDLSEHTEVYLRYTSLFLTFPIVSYGAWPFYRGAVNAVRARQLTMDIPVSVAIILAFSASLWATFSQQGEVYFESVSMFTFLLLIGKFLEFRARSRAAEVSANLLKLMPLSATLWLDNEEKLVPAKQLKNGDTVLIKPGETVPGDGVVIQGTSSVNEAMLSGEQRPVSKKTGDKVFAGTVNSDGKLIVQISAQNSKSLLSNLIRLNEEAQTQKPKIAELSDKVAQYFVAIILTTAIGTAFYWFGHSPDKAFWITISVLVATCPCALSLATPTALTCATTRLNQLGILIKSAHVLETMNKVNQFAFDKTGTLTTGDFNLTQVNLIDESYTQEQVLALAASLEIFSQHPIAKAFLPYKSKAIATQNIKIETGLGITGDYNGDKVVIGKASWLLPESLLDAHRHCQCVLTIKGNAVASFELSDGIRSDSSELIEILKQDNISSMMLTGDHQHGAELVAEKLKLESYHASLTPEQKLTRLKAQQDQGKVVAVVGDGVNDTPVFGQAHVSVSMGSGTDIAKNGADVILLNNRLSALNQLRTIARKTKSIMWQNYFWALGYNAIILPLAVAGFVTPYIAVLGMSASSILVITNSLRLLKK